MAKFFSLFIGICFLFSKSSAQIPVDIYDYYSANTTTVHSAGPNLAKAQAYVNLQGVACCANPDISAWDCPIWCPASAAIGQSFYSTLMNTTYDTFAIVTVNNASNANEIVVTFRGSTNVPNVVCDAVFFPIGVGSSGVAVHRGFYNATMSLYPQVVTTVSALLASNPTYNLVITGLSLGAAMATLTTYLLANQLNFPPGITSVSPASYSLYTYGEPRVGNKAFADYFNAQSGMNITRTTHNADIIPHIPPVSLGFVHHGTELWTGTLVVPGGSKSCSRSKYEDPTCSNSVPLLFNAVDHLTYFNMFVASCDLASPGTELFPFLQQGIVTFTINNGSIATSVPDCIINNSYST